MKAQFEKLLLQTKFCGIRVPIKDYLMSKHEMCNVL